MQAAAGMPVGQQQGEQATEQRQDAGIAAGADNRGGPVEVGHPLHFPMVGDEGVAMQARALDQRDTVLQQFLGLALDAVRRYAEQGGIDLLKLGEMPDHRQVAQPVERCGSAPHHAGQAQGRIVQQQLGAALAERVARR